MTDSGMNDLISRAAALEIIEAVKNVSWSQSGKVLCGKMYSQIKDLPAVDAAPVRHGRWINENPDDSLDPRMRCSICTGIESPLIKWRYCPYCGAKMDGERRDSE